ncbi:MAG: SRPBCC domain-containing protein [Leptospirales bacterium]|nr:SRPBCC domain-containing protein [Leptospirales bacterium]
MKMVGLVLGIVIGIFIIAILGLYLYGRSLPADHTASVSREYPVSRSLVWKLITTYPEIPTWWPDVKSIETETRPDGTVVSWNLDSHGNRIPFITAEEIFEKKLVRKIASDDLPFGGTWTFELESTGPSQTRLSIREDGFVKPPLFRAMGQLFIGQDTTLKSFASALATKTAAIR